MFLVPVPSTETLQERLIIANCCPVGSRHVPLNLLTLTLPYQAGAPVSKALPAPWKEVISYTVLKQKVVSLPPPFAINETQQLSPFPFLFLFLFLNRAWMWKIAYWAHFPASQELQMWSFASSDKNLSCYIRLDSKFSPCKLLSKLCI